MFIGIWATYFLSKWKQKQNELTVTWDLNYHKDKLE